MQVPTIETPRPLRGVLPPGKTFEVPNSPQHCHLSNSDLAKTDIPNMLAVTSTNYDGWRWAAKYG